MPRPGGNAATTSPSADGQQAGGAGGADGESRRLGPGGHVLDSTTQETAPYRPVRPPSLIRVTGSTCGRLGAWWLAKAWQAQAAPGAQRGHGALFYYLGSHHDLSNQYPFVRGQ